MKLYVGNLSYATTADDLRAWFAQAGTVISVDLITDRYSGESKGFGFVEMSNQSEGENAIRMLNGQTLDNREIRVNIARPREERGPRGFSNKRGGRDRRSGGGSRKY